MDATIDRVSERVVSVVKAWESVDTVTVLKFGTDRLDPSFLLSFDVYYHATVPDAGTRESAFDFTRVFESAVDGEKDRFLVGDVPVRLEYKAIADVDAQIRNAVREFGGMETTYGFYRLKQGVELYRLSNWLPVVRRTLDDLPAEFWKRRVAHLRGRMEHFLSDLSSAVFADEQLFYVVSLAGFLHVACQLALAVNRVFEPAGRSMRAAVAALPAVPSEFTVRFETLLRDDGAVSRARKREIAQLLAASLLTFSE